MAPTGATRTEAKPKRPPKMGTLDTCGSSVFRVCTNQHQKLNPARKTNRHPAMPAITHLMISVIMYFAS